MRRLFWQRIVGALLIVSCFFWFYHHIYRRVLIGGRTITVEDPRSKNILTLRKDFSSGDAQSIRLYFIGELNGKARLHITDRKKADYSYSVGPGKFTLPVELAWTEPLCAVEYDPENVTAGQVAVRYSFATGKKKG